MIYAGGFFSGSDRNQMNKIIQMPPPQLSEASWNFADSRLEEMLFRYRARNFPDTLSQQEADQWKRERLARLESPSDPRQLDFERFAKEIVAARETYAGDGKAQNILDQLAAWGQQLSLPESL